MNQEKRLMFLYAEEPLHAGAGTSTGTIDNPIQREQHTKIPKIEGSTFRGAVRENSWEKFASKCKINNKTYNEIETELLQEKDKKKSKELEEKLLEYKNGFAKVFGYDNNGEQHSAIDLPDAHLLFFPVRSWKGVIAWITSPFVLSRFVQYYNRLFDENIKIENIDEVNNYTVLVQNEEEIVEDGKVLFEEFLFETKRRNIKIDNTELGEWIVNKLGGDKAHEIAQMLKKHIAVVSDDIFIDFVELYTAKITRNKINSATGTAEGGALFNEEYLPADSILYAPVIANNEFSTGNYKTAQEIMSDFENWLPEMFKLGGNQMIGKGLVSVHLYPKIDENQENSTETQQNQ